MLIPTELDRAVELLAAIALIGVGVAVLHDGRVLTGVAVLRGHVLAGIALIGIGVAFIGYGLVILGRIGIVAHALTWLAFLTKDPSSKAQHDDHPTVSGPDDPPQGTRAPRRSLLKSHSPRLRPPTLPHQLIWHADIFTDLGLLRGLCQFSRKASTAGQKKRTDILGRQQMNDVRRGRVLGVVGHG
ncbi:MAG: hypothetical protein ACRDRX_27255 [Pseudonocardiaceae bacterium]